jgi:hypothetical protein
MDVGKTKDLIIDLRNAPGGGEGLAGTGLTADAGRVLARPGPAALTALLRDIALLIVDVGRVRVAGRDPLGRVAAGRFGVLAHVPVIARARAGRRGR